MHENLILCLSNPGDDNRLTLADKNGNLKKFGEFPELYNSEGIIADNLIFTSYMSASPDGNHFVLACTETDIIEIYSPEDGLIKRLHGPVGIKLSVGLREAGAGAMLHRRPWYMTYGMIDGNEKEFWVGYNGFHINSDNYRPSAMDMYPKTIFCFDWNGNPIRKIRVTNPFIAYDVDWQGKVLYALELINDAPALIAYTISHILNN